MLEEGGQVLGEIGEAMGRSVEAWSGAGSLDKKEDDLLNLKKKKKGCFWCGNALGFKPLSGMPRTLELYPHCPLVSGIGRMKRKKGERSLRWRKMLEFWPLVYSQVCSLWFWIALSGSLTANPRTELKDAGLK